MKHFYHLMIAPEPGTVLMEVPVLLADHQSLTMMATLSVSIIRIVLIIKDSIPALVGIVITGPTMMDALKSHRICS